MSKYSDRKVDLTEENNSLVIIYNWIKEGSKVLDVGCDEGYFARELKEQKKCKVWGLEVFHEAAVAAREICEEVWENDLDWEDPFIGIEEKFDYIVFADVLEHTKYPLRILKKAKNLLKKDGEILISIPHIAHLSARLELLNGSFEYEKTGIFDDTHLKYFTKKTFSELIFKSGMVPVEITGVFRDVPKKIIKKFLSNVGLEADKKFWELSQTFEMQAYQLLFRVRKTGTHQVQLKQPNKYKPMTLADDSVIYLRKKVQELEDKILDYDKNLRLVIDQRDKLRDQLLNQENN